MAHQVGSTRQKGNGGVDVFISYQWQHKPLITELYNSLRDEGFSCWMDQSQLEGGSQLVTEIAEGLDSCQLVLSCVSQKYLKSASCQKEVSYACNLKKKIIPLLLEREAYPFTGKIGFLLDEAVYIKFTELSNEKKDWKHHSKFAGLVEQIKQIVGEKKPQNGEDKGVKDAQASISRGFTGLLKSITSLKAQRVTDVFEWVYQMEFIQGRLWLLLDDRIKTISSNGSPLETYTPGLRDARGMCAVGNTVIVADRNKGLLKLGDDGDIIDQLDDGKYLSVTTCPDQRSVLALKQDDDDKIILICKFDVFNDTLIYTQPSTIPIDGTSVSCCLMANKMYICSSKDSCIFVVDIITGAKVSVLGSKGRSKPGELDRPTQVYCDDDSRALLVLDMGNHRLQVYHVTEDKWAVVKSFGAELKLPKSATVDGEGNLWVYADNQLCKCVVKK